MTLLYPSRIGFQFSEPDFTRNFDFSQSQNARLVIQARKWELHFYLDGYEVKFWIASTVLMQLKKTVTRLVKGAR